MSNKEFDEAIEAEIVEKELTAPRVTKAHIDALMATVIFHGFQVQGTTTVVAVALLPMGEDQPPFTLATAMSACASPENFDLELGKKIAAQKAMNAATDKLWELEGYSLAKELYMQRMQAESE